MDMDNQRVLRSTSNDVPRVERNDPNKRKKHIQRPSTRRYTQGCTATNSSRRSRPVTMCRRSCSPILTLKSVRRISSRNWSPRIRGLNRRTIARSAGVTADRFFWHFDGGQPRKETLVLGGDGFPRIFALYARPCQPTVPFDSTLILHECLQDFEEPVCPFLPRIGDTGVTDDFEVGGGIVDDHAVSR